MAAQARRLRVSAPLPVKALTRVSSSSGIVGHFALAEPQRAQMQLRQQSTAPSESVRHAGLSATPLWYCGSGAVGWRAAVSSLKLYGGASSSSPRRSISSLSSRSWCRHLRCSSIRLCSSDRQSRATASPVNRDLSLDSSLSRRRGSSRRERPECLWPERLWLELLDLCFCDSCLCLKGNKRPIRHMLTDA